MDTMLLIGFGAQWFITHFIMLKLIKSFRIIKGITIYQNISSYWQPIWSLREILEITSRRRMSEDQRGMAWSGSGHIDREGWRHKDRICVFNRQARLKRDPGSKTFFTNISPNSTNVTLHILARHPSCRETTSHNSTVWLHRPIKQNSCTIPLGIKLPFLIEHLCHQFQMSIRSNFASCETLRSNGQLVVVMDITGLGCR